MLGNSNSLSKIKKESERQVFSSQLKNSLYMNQQKPGFFDSGKGMEMFNSLSLVNDDQKKITRLKSQEIRTREVFNMQSHLKKRKKYSPFLNNSINPNYLPVSKPPYYLDATGMNPEDDRFKSMPMINEESKDDKTQNQNMQNKNFDISLNSYINNNDLARSQLKVSYKFGNKSKKSSNFNQSNELLPMKNKLLGKREKFSINQPGNDQKMRIPGTGSEMNVILEKPQNQKKSKFNTPEYLDQSNASSALLYQNHTKSEFEKKLFHPFKEAEQKSEALHENHFFETKSKSNLSYKQSNAVALEKNYDLSINWSENKNNASEVGAEKEEKFHWNNSLFVNKNQTGKQKKSSNSLFKTIYEESYSDKNYDGK